MILAGLAMDVKNIPAPGIAFVVKQVRDTSVID